MYNLIGIVSSVNEGHLLEDCLASLKFCDKIIVIDQESIDDTEKIANKCGAYIIKKKRYNYVEEMHAELLPDIDSEFVLIIDPDERIDPVLQKQIQKLLIKCEADIGVVYVPCQFYFGRKALKGTVWGGKNMRRLIFRTKAVDFNGEVHKGYGLKDGYKKYNIDWDINNFVHHYWMQDSIQFISKHKRYIIGESRTMYSIGKKFSWLKIISTPIKEFYYSYFIKNGIKDGIYGVLLSMFWAWYKTSIIWELRSIEKNVKNK